MEQHNYTLQNARRYEAANAAPAEKRPVFHAVPPVGWCNDPNGFSRFGGKYHLFFQYHPYSTAWGPMHWGHATTTDFIHWEQQPCALAPDTAADNAGCFSGGAIEWQGRQLLLYTGVCRRESADGAVRETQQQCLAVGDGVNYTKCAQNPVIPPENQPAGASMADFRDPYLFARDGRLYALIGGRGANGHGRLLLYAADDAGTQWTFVRVLAGNDGSLGSMWECPSLFPLGGKEILLFSPQYMRTSPDGRYHCGNGVVALIGQWGGPSSAFERQTDMPVDAGLDFYAPQVVADPEGDGRTVMLGWMQNWDHCYPPAELPFYGQMTLPRELFMRDGRLCQRPVRELDAARRLRAVHKGVALEEGERALAGVQGRVLDMALTLSRAPDCRRFGLCVACDDTHFTELRLDFEENLLRLDRRYAGGVRDAAELRESPLTDLPAVFTLRVVLDRYSAEFFVNDGAQTATVALYDTPQSADGILFYTRGGCTMDVQAYELDI